MSGFDEIITQSQPSSLTGLVTLNYYTDSTDLQRVVLPHISQWCLLTLKVKTRPIRTVDQAARRKTQSRMKATSSFLS